MDVISRKDAKAAGLKRYFTGQPCKHGHRCERHVTGRGCLECKRAATRLWDQQHPERERLRYQKDRDRMLARAKARYHAKAGQIQVEA